MKFNVLLFDFMHLLLCHCAATQISYFTFSRLRSLVAIVTQSDARAFCASARERERQRDRREQQRLREWKASRRLFISLNSSGTSIMSRWLVYVSPDVDFRQHFLSYVYCLLSHSLAKL